MKTPLGRVSLPFGLAMISAPNEKAATVAGTRPDEPHLQTHNPEDIHMNVDFPSSMPRVLTGILLIGGILALPSSTTVAAPLSEGPPTLLQHLRSELKSQDAERQSNALVDVITLAYCSGTCDVNLQSVQKQKIRIENETGKGSVFDLTGLAPDVLDVYQRGPTDELRLMAVTALMKIGDENTIDDLARMGPSTSSRVNRVAQLSLAAFYTAAYPELAARAIETRHLSLEDVEHARTIRVRQAKNDAKNAKKQG